MGGVEVCAHVCMYVCVWILPGQTLPPERVPTEIDQEEQSQNMHLGCPVQPALTDALGACGSNQKQTHSNLHHAHLAS